MLMRAWSSQNCMTSRRCKRRKHELPFLMFPSVKFCESLYSSWYRCLLHNMSFWKKHYLRISYFKSKIGHCKIFKNPLDKFFIFSNKIIVRNRFHKTGEFQDILPRLTLEKEANRWKIAKKWLSLRLFVAMVTVCNKLILTKKKSQVRD